MVFESNATSNGTTGYKLTFLVQPSKEFIKEALQINCGDTPLIHHPPWTHSRSTTGTVYSEEVYSSLRGEFHRSSQIRWSIGTCFEGDILGT